MTTTIYQFQTCHPIIHLNILLLLFSVSCCASNEKCLKKPFKQLLRFYTGLIMKHWLIEALLLVDSGSLLPPTCKWVTFRRTPSGSSGRWAVTVMGRNLAWINIPWSRAHLVSTQHPTTMYGSPQQRRSQFWEILDIGNILCVGQTDTLTDPTKISKTIAKLQFIEINSWKWEERKELFDWDQ